MRELLKELKKEIQEFQEVVLLEKLEFKQMMKNSHFWQVQLLNIFKIMMTLSFWVSGLFTFRSLVALFFVQKAWPGLHNMEGREQVLSSIAIVFYLIIVFMFSYGLFKGLSRNTMGSIENIWCFVKRGFVVWSFWLILMGLRNESVEGTVRDMSQSFQITIVTLLLGYSFFMARQIIRFVVFRKIDQQDVFEQWVPMFRWYEVEERTRQDAYNVLDEEKGLQTGFKSSKFKTIRFKLKYSKIEVKRTTYPEGREVYWSKVDIPTKKPEPLDFSDYPLILEDKFILDTTHKK